MIGDLYAFPSLEAAVAGVHGVRCVTKTNNFQGDDPNRPEVGDLVGLRMLVQSFLEAKPELQLRVVHGREEVEVGGNERELLVRWR